MQNDRCPTGRRERYPPRPRDEPLPDPPRLPGRNRPPLGLRAGDRRRRHVADADGRTRGRRERPAAHRAPDRPRRGAHVDRPAVARPGRLLRRPRARGHARRDPPRDRLRPARARPRVRDRADRRRVVALDLRHRLPRDPRRPVGLDASRADGRAPALRRRPLAARRRRPPRCPEPHAARPAAPRPLGEPPRLRRPRRRPRDAARARRAGARTTPRVDPAGARRPRPPLRARDAVRVGHRRLLRADARRRAVRADPPRVAVVEPERDDRALLAARARRRRRPRAPAAAGPPDLLRARRPRGDASSARCRPSAA